MKKNSFLVFMLVSTASVFAQTKSLSSYPDSTLYVIDGVKHIGDPHLTKEDILEISTYKDSFIRLLPTEQKKIANKEYGPEVRNGLVIIRTSLSYRIKTFKKLLSGFSAEYKCFAENDKAGQSGINYIIARPKLDADVYRDETAIANQLYKLNSSDIKSVAANVIPGSKGLRLSEVVITLKK